jgi:ribosomal protein L20
MYYLLRAGITVNRKVLADLATSEPYSFRSLVEAVSLARPKPVVVEQLR